MAISGNVELLVTPEVLNHQAVQVEKNVLNMRKKFEAMNTLVEKSKGYWIGDAGDMHRKNYADQSDNIEVMLRRLGEHPGDLRAIAQTYTTSELNIQQSIISALPGDVL